MIKIVCFTGQYHDITNINSPISGKDTLLGLYKLGFKNFPCINANLSNMVCLTKDKIDNIDLKENVNYSDFDIYIIHDLIEKDFLESFISKILKENTNYYVLVHSGSTSAYSNFREHFISLKKNMNWVSIERFKCQGQHENWNDSDERTWPYNYLIRLLDAAIKKKDKEFEDNFEKLRTFIGEK